MIREQIRDRAHEREQFLPDSYGQNAATRFARVKKCPTGEPGGRVYFINSAARARLISRVIFR